jgi:pyroglutamyl-peptidase
VAINVNDARIPDNAGAKPIDTPVIADGPAAYFTSLPIKAMLQAMLAEGMRAEVSQTAGTFVCNHDLLRPDAPAGPAAVAGVRGGLVHVPWLPEQGAAVDAPRIGACPSSTPTCTATPWSPTAR